jgi:hypothetical protein
MEGSVPVTFKVVARVSAALYRVRVVLAVAGCTALAWFAYIVFVSDGASTVALLPLTLAVWVALALGMAHSLAALPPAIAPGDSLIRRFRKRFRQAVYALVLVAMLGLTGFVLMLSWRTLGVIAA